MGESVPLQKELGDNGHRSKRLCSDNTAWHRATTRAARSADAAIYPRVTASAVLENGTFQASERCQPTL